jgi:hypothetical protein
MAVTVFADALAQIVSPLANNNFSENIYICAVSERGMAMFDSAMLVVSGVFPFGTTNKFAVTFETPQLHIVNDVIAVLPTLV